MSAYVRSQRLKFRLRFFRSCDFSACHPILRLLRAVRVQFLFLLLFEEPFDLFPHKGGALSLLDGAHPDDDELLLQAEQLDLGFQLVAEGEPEQVWQGRYRTGSR